MYCDFLAGYVGGTSDIWESAMNWIIRFSDEKEEEIENIKFVESLF